MADEAKIKLKADASQLQGELDKAEGSVKKWGGAVKKVLAAAAAAFVAKKIFNFGKSLLDLADEQLGAELKLQRALETTGNSVGYNIDQLKAMASELQGVSTYGDESTLAVQKMLLQFKNVRGDEFRRTLQAAADMAAFLETDMQSAAKTLGVALNEPEMALSRLRRQGVSFTEDQKKTIESMLELGDVAGAQQAILAQLENTYGGAAAAATQTFSGRMQQVKNTLGDLGEEIGKSLIPILEETLIPALEKTSNFIANYVVPKVASIITWAKDTGAAITNFLAPGFELLLDVAVGALAVVATAIVNWKKVLELNIKTVQLAIVEVAGIIKHTFTEQIPGLLSWFADQWQNIFTDIANFSSTVFTNIAKNVLNMWDAIIGIFKGEGFNFDWTPLTEGFETSISEWPQIAARTMSDTEKSLRNDIAKINSDLDQGFQETFNDLRSSFLGLFSAPQASKVDMTPSVVSSVATIGADNVSQEEDASKEEATKEDEKRFQASIEGLASLNSRITAAAASSEDPVKKAVDKSNESLDKIAKSEGNLEVSLEQLVDLQRKSLELLPGVGGLA